MGRMRPIQVRWLNHTIGSSRQPHTHQQPAAAGMAAAPDSPGQQQQEQAIVCQVQHDEGTRQVSRAGIGLLRVAARDTVALGQLVF